MERRSSWRSSGIAAHAGTTGATRWDEHLEAAAPVDGPYPISQKWMSGMLGLEAGNRLFTHTPINEGKVTLQNRHARRN